MKQTLLALLLGLLLSVTALAGDIPGSGKSDPPPPPPSSGSATSTTIAARQPLVLALITVFTALSV